MGVSMRIGHQMKDGTWTGAVGAYLTELKLNATANAAGHEDRRLTTPGMGTMAKWERSLRVLADVARNNGISFVGELRGNHMTLTYIRLMEEARKDPRVKDNVSPNTARSFVTCLKAFESFCIRKKWIPRTTESLCSGLKMPRKRERRMFVPEEHKMREAFQVAEQRHLLERVTLELMYYTGLRRADILTLRWDDLNLNARTLVTWSDKVNDLHEGNLPQPLVDTLKLWYAWLRERFGDVNGEWFVICAREGRTSGEHMHPEWPVIPWKHMAVNSVNHIVHDNLVRVGYRPEDMRGQKCHITRRAVATHMKKHGTPVEFIAQHLGHGSKDNPNTKQTNDYLRHGLDDEELADWVDKLGEAEPEPVAIEAPREQLIAYTSYELEKTPDPLVVLWEMRQAGLVSDEKVKELMGRL